MGKIEVSRATLGRLTETQATVDLVSSVTAPVEIDLYPTGGDRYVQLSIYVAGEFYYTVSTTASLALTRIGSDTTRRLLPAGFYGFPCVGNSTEKVYLRSSGAAVTDGISYEFVEGD